jgi:hypothetical protein
MRNDHQFNSRTTNFFLIHVYRGQTGNIRKPEFRLRRNNPTDVYVINSPDHHQPLVQKQVPWTTGAVLESGTPESRRLA